MSMSIYSYVYKYVYVCTDTHTHTCTFLYVYIQTRAYASTRTYTHTHTHMHRYKYVRTNTHIFAYLYMVEAVTGYWSVSTGRLNRTPNCQTCTREVSSRKGGMYNIHFEHPTHHINWHTNIQRTGIGKKLRDRARSGQRPPRAFCMNLLHHTTIGTVSSVHFVRSDCKMIHFFTKHSQNQTVPLILSFFWETFKYSSFECIPLELRLSVRIWPTCQKYFSKVN